MRGLVIAPSVVCVLGLSFWAYQENYRTQAAQNDVEELSQEIGALRDRLALMEAEWAYLNRPSRLAELVDLNFERLKLQAFAPAQFGDIDDLAFPPDPTELVVDGLVETRGILAEDGQYP